jgi:hypothetical protein
MVKSPIKTQAEHFEWFVSYQVLGQSLAEIARTSSTDSPTVHRAINSIGRLLAGAHWQQWKRPRLKSGPRPTAT